MKLLNLQDFEGENKVSKIKCTNIRLLGEYKFHNYIEEQQIRIRYLTVSQFAHKFYLFVNVAYDTKST